MNNMFFTYDIAPKWEYYMVRGKPTINIISIPKTFYNRKPHKIKDLEYLCILMYIFVK